MKRASLPKIVAAALMAGLSLAPAPEPQAPGVATTATGQRRDASAPVLPACNTNATTLRQLVGDSGWYSVRLAPAWPHNRPQPGWRAVQSRARHGERMRRQRRNA